MYRHVLRNVVYPVYETHIQGRRTFSYFKEYDDNQWKSRDEVESIQWKKLTALLLHCMANVPFYRRKWRELGMEIADIRSIEDFKKIPVLSKDDIRQNYDELIAENYRGRTLKKSTGGSTGQPVWFEYTRESYERRNAVAWRGYEWAGAGLGRKTLYLWSVDLLEECPRERLKKRLYNHVLQRKVLNSFALSDGNIEEYIAGINRYRPEVIVGYVNSLYQIARHTNRTGHKLWRPVSIVTGAEALNDDQREEIESAFGCKAYNTYGCREFMLIASECEERNGLHVNADHLVVESVPMGGDRVPIGEVLITDLHNYGMPFIRYANGDLSSGYGRHCGCGRGLPVIDRIEGRKLDAISTLDGRLVPGEYFPHMLKDVPGIYKFQVIQETLEDLEIKLVSGRELTEDWVNYLTRSIRKTLGDTIRIRYTYLEDIPLTPSGKHRVTISRVIGE